VLTTEADDVRMDDLDAAAEVFDNLMNGTHYERQARAHQAMLNDGDGGFTERWISRPNQHGYDRC